MTVSYGPMLRVDTVTCRSCGRILSQSARIEPNDDDGRCDIIDKPCSPAFARTTGCPDHPYGPPDNGLRYSTDACPVLWNARHHPIPED